MSRAQRLGDWGEDLACSLLAACGYEILARRFRAPGGEIDVVARRRGVVAFVEVKTRGPSAPAAPEAWVDRRKLRRLRTAARHWLAAADGPAAAEYRFDVVAVRHGGALAGVEVRHLVGVA
jgi:putative endonuclease